MILIIILWLKLSDYFNLIIIMAGVCCGKYNEQRGTRLYHLKCHTSQIAFEGF